MGPEDLDLHPLTIGLSFSEDPNAPPLVAPPLVAPPLVAPPPKIKKEVVIPWLVGATVLYFLVIRK